MKKQFHYLLFTLLFLGFNAENAVSQSILLDPYNHPKFENPIPAPEVIDATKVRNLSMYMKQTTQWLGLERNGQKLYTTVWGYGQKGVSYPGPTIRTKKHTRLSVRWNNKLPYSHILPVDNTLHIAKPKSGRGIPTVTHLHGGHTESASDGLPEAWFTQYYHYIRG